MRIYILFILSHIFESYAFDIIFSSKWLKVYWLLYLQCSHSVYLRCSVSTCTTHRRKNVKLCAAIGTDHLLYNDVSLYIVHSKGNFIQLIFSHFKPLWSAFQTWVYLGHLGGSINQVQLKQFESKQWRHDWSGTTICSIRCNSKFALFAYFLWKNILAWKGLNGIICLIYWGKYV